MTHDPIRNRKRFEEHGQPDWWQIPRPAWKGIFNTEIGRAFLNSLGLAAPFRNTIGKSLWVAETGHGVTDIDKEYIARNISISYLFAAATGPWKPHAFERVWNQCVHYYDPSKVELKYFLYAPIWGFSGISRSLALGDGLEIRRLTASRRAQLASLNPTLAGVTIERRLRLWPAHYFVKEFKLRKYIDTEKNRTEMMSSPIRFNAWLSEEVAFLRALLSEEVAVSNHALIYEGYPPDPAGGVENSLPWRPHSPFSDRRPSRSEVVQYAVTRAQFKELAGKPGWGAVAASMHRFALAWENPFPADSLADIIAALERLMVREKTEVGYKLRVRVANLLVRKQSERQTILKNVAHGYTYRSRVAHGDFVFDAAWRWETAKALNCDKGKDGNPFHDVNEVHRIKGILAGYYKAALSKIIRSGQLEIDWASRGL